MKQEFGGNQFGFEKRTKGTIDCTHKTYLGFSDFENEFDYA